MNEITHVKDRNLATAAETPFGWLRHEIDRLFEDFGRPASRGSFFGTGFGPAPAVEMVEKDKEYRFTAELPGIAEDAIDVHIADGVLTLKGEKREEEAREGKGFMLSERRYGAFERHIRLPADADAEKVEAKFKKGILTLTIAKNDSAPGVRKIAINAE